MPAYALYNRGLLLAKIESVFGTDPTPTPTANALLIENPVFSVDAQQLERNNLEATLSPEAVVVGRKIASCTFLAECKNNGTTAGTTPPQLDPLLRACQMAATARTVGAAGSISSSPPFKLGETQPTGAFTYTKSVAYTGTLPRVVTLTCTTGGGSGTAEFTVASAAVGTGQAAYSVTGVVMTNAMAFVLSGAGDGSPAITPTVVTSFLAGDKFVILLTPAGYDYKFISDPALTESVTLYIYYEGLLHKMTGCRGTWTLDAPGGEFSKFQFTFTGNYVAPTDSTLPTTAVYETTKPPQVELANLLVHGGADNTLNSALVAAGFTMDIQNNVIARSDINQINAYAGAEITGRRPVGTFSPEITTVAAHDFWNNLTTAARIFFQLRIGRTGGNVVQLVMPYTQYSNLTYQDRDGLRALEATLRFSRTTADDELILSFM